MTANLSPKIQEVVTLLQRGAISAAERMLEQLEVAHPHHADVLHLRAMAAKQRGDYARAEQSFRASLKSAPAQAPVHSNLANMLASLDRPTEAIASYKAALELEPGFTTAWHNLALALSKTGAHKDALVAATRYAELTKRSSQSAELLASIYEHAGDMAAACREVRAALKHFSGDARLWSLLGELLRKGVEFEAAAEAFEEARRLGHRDPGLYQNLAEAYYENRKLERAVAVLDDAIQVMPDNATLHYARAKFRWEALPGEDHLEALKKAIPTQPNNVALWGAYFDLLSHEGRFEDILKGLSEAYRFDIRAPRLSLAEAIALVRTGRTEEAAAVFEQLLQLDPDGAVPKLNYAALLMKVGEFEKAEKLCAEVLARDPADQKAWTFRGTAWQLMGDERANWLFDFDRMVNPVDIEAPAGYSSPNAFFDEARQELSALHRMQSHPLDQTLRGGTQTNGFLFRLKNPVIKQLQAQIRKAVATVIAKFPDDPDHPLWRRRGGDFDFIGAWSVRLKSQGYHTNHIHPEGWLSSALYISLPTQVSEGTGQEGHIQFGVPTAEMGLDLAPARIVKPKVGRLVLFPSYMWHGTIPFSSEEPRMTVAFDVVPKG
ncbi:tetratricopeptide repeat protein [Kordiimonas sp.]|uniref:tetratricopeptide repeat protein n=1 Tax=Kordiimonas sp. TaxID=1970157 RepID=UPI003A9237A3